MHGGELKTNAASERFSLILLKSSGLTVGISDSDTIKTNFKKSFILLHKA